MPIFFIQRTKQYDREKLRVLVTGGSGFVGSYLINNLLDEGNEVFSASRLNTVKLEHLRSGSEFLECDFENSKSIKNLIKKIEPEIVYHLASQTNLPESWKDPSKTLKVNVNGTATLLEEIKNSKTDPKIHIVCSSVEYGSVDDSDIPIHEDVKFKPSSPYAVSKIAMDMLGYSYFKSYGMKVTRSRPFAIIGPGKSSDALTQWCKNIVEIENGQKDCLLVGDVSVIRDHLDVRDAIFGLKAIVMKGQSGQVYNICSSEGLQLNKLINTLKLLCKKTFDVKQDPTRLRPYDDKVMIGDNTRLKKLKWQSKYPIKQSIEDTLNYWRKHF